MIRIAVLAHFMSANLGDRYQGTGLMRRLCAHFGVNQIVAVNSHTDDQEVSGWQFNDGSMTWEIVNPRKVEWSAFDVVLAATGSLHQRTQFLTRFAEILVEQPTPRLLVWGGFSNVYGDEGIVDQAVAPMRKILSSDRLEFIARSELEKRLFIAISGKRKAILGGDPILLNEKPHNEHQQFERSRSPQIPLVINGQSVTAGCDQAFADLAVVANPVLSIDPVEDARFLRNHSQASVVTVNNIQDFAKLARDWSMIVSTRLHGGILAKFFNASCRIVLVPYDRSIGLNGSAKYFSVATSAAGAFAPIARLSIHPGAELFTKQMDDHDIAVAEAHSRNFQRYVRLTERTFYRIVQDIESAKQPDAAGGIG